MEPLARNDLTCSQEGLPRIQAFKKNYQGLKVSDLQIAMVRDQETVLINCLQKPLILLRCTGRKRKFSGNYYIQKVLLFELSNLPFENI